VFAGAAPVQAAPGLAVYPGGPELTEAAVLRLHPEELMDALSQRAEEVVICDCPPGNEHLERLGLTAAAVALVVADAHPFAAIGAGRVLSDLGSMRRRGRRCPDRVALVLSRLDSRRASDRALPDRLAALHPDVPQLCLHQDAALAAATSDRVLIAGRTRGVLDLDRIAAWILEDPEPC
jgi:chromosome partitioning protein